MAITRYLDTSFKGAPALLVESSSDEGGPRHVLHEFPGRRYAYAEPSGDFPDRYSLEFHFIGDGFETRAKTFEDALRTPGPGPFVHPHRGTRYCSVEAPFRVQRQTRELGMVRFSVTFVEVGPPEQPTIRVDTGGAVTSAATKAKGPLVDYAASDFSVRGPDFLTRTATAILAGPRGVTAVLSRVNNRMHSAFGLVDEASRAILDFGNQVGDLLDSPAELALSLQNLLNAVITSVGAAGLDLNRGDAQRNRARVAAVLGYANALGTFGDTLSDVPQTTGTRQQQAQNQAVIVDVVEASAVIETVSTLSILPLDNTQQAGDAYRAVADLFARLDDRGTLDDASTQALRDVRATFHQHLRNTVAELPELGRFTPAVTMPACVLSYRIYGDSARDIDIIERNASIEHPGFVAGGVELEVAQV